MHTLHNFGLSFLLYLGFAASTAALARTDNPIAKYGGHKSQLGLGHGSEGNMMEWETGDGCMPGWVWEAGECSEDCAAQAPSGCRGTLTTTGFLSPQGCALGQGAAMVRCVCSCSI